METLKQELASKEVAWLEDYGIQVQIDDTTTDVSDMEMVDEVCFK